MSRLTQILTHIKESDLYFRILKMENKPKKIFLVALGLFLPFLPSLTSGYILTVAIFILIYSIIGLGIHLLVGYSGILSLGQVAFFCLGAYISAIFTTQWGISPWIALFIAAIINGIIAYILSRPFLRSGGPGNLSLAVITLAFAMIVYLAVARLPITGGHDGITGIPPFTIGNLRFGDKECYYMILVICGIFLLLIYNLTDVIIGRGLRALNTFSGGDSVAAMTSGVNALKLRTQVFVTATILASIAGSLLCHWLRTVNPELFNILNNLILVMMVGIGGFGSIWGSLVGSLFYFGLKEGISIMAGTAVMGWEIIIFSLIFILIMIFLPGGITSLPDKWREWVKKTSVTVEVKKGERRFIVNRD